MKIFFAFVSFVFFCYQCESVELECEYYSSYVYTCDVQNRELITSKDEREVDSIKVKGQHEDGKNDMKVKEFYSRDKVVKFFPRGLTKFFKDIEEVAIAYAELEEVSKEDLKEFGGNLKVLRLHGNKIEIIGKNLFEFNPNLEKIYLDYNKIKHISDGAFNGLEKIKTLYIYNNPCTDSDEDFARDDRSKVLELIEKVEASCKDLSLTTIEPETTEAAKVDPESKCKDENLVMGKSLVPIHSKLSSLELQISSLVKLIEQQNLNFDQKFSILHSKFEEVCKEKEPKTSA